MRGKRKDGKLEVVQNRITPACAGKTSEDWNPYELVTDHPRVCGENGRTEWDALREDGSPPRVRGKLFVTACGFSFSRITPACAAKTMRLSCSQGLWPDHPRVCGENIEIVETPVLNIGSPPRVRGKRSGDES